MTHLTTGSDITRTMVRNGYVVNPDNVTISIDGNTTSVLIGQNMQFMCGGKKTGQVTIRGIKDTPTEGYLFKSNTTGWFDTSGMEKGCIMRLMVIAGNCLRFPSLKWICV